MFYVEIFEPWFVSGPEATESQLTLLRTVVSCWQHSPARALQVLDKLYQIGLFEPAAALDWALQALAKSSDAAHVHTLVNSLPLQVIDMVAKRTQERSGLLYTIYTQRGFLGSLALPQGVLGMQVDEIGGA
jgi:hypothetical protein